MSDDPARVAAQGWIELTIWGVAWRHVPSALTRIAMDRRAIHRMPGLRFAKLLGTASGQTFAMRDADPHHWAMLTVWNDPLDAAEFRAGPVYAAWRRIANEQLTVSLMAMASRGRWSGIEPFAVPGLSAGPVIGPVAAITRARLRPSRMLSFWRAVPPIAASLRLSPGLLLALSMGESPIGLSGTFSMWSSQDAMSQFAHRSPAHASAIRRTRPERWYAEELFARFAVRSAHGSYQERQFHISPASA
jgi:heme-degrading monooxygenase HmoA